MAKAHKIIGVKPSRSYCENARIILPQKVEEVYTWEPFIHDEERREELHNLRISLKRLRYTMEIFHLAYMVPKVGAKDAAVTHNERLAEFLSTIIDLQRILGEVHDCDVALKVLRDYCISNRKRDCDYAHHSDAEKPAKLPYKTFLKKWEQLAATDFKQKLLSFLTS